MEKVQPVFTIEYKKSFSASGICDVLAFNEREIKLAIVEGGRMVITGESLKIVGFNKQSGEFKLVGIVSGVKFLSATGSPLKRLFK